jgi:hypothetical protein
MTSLLDLLPLDGANSASNTNLGASLIGWRSSNVGAYLDQLSSYRTVNDIPATSVGQIVWTVPGGYVVGQLDVFLNGLHLTNGIDYTALNGTTVSLISSSAINSVVVGSIMVVSALNTFATAGAVSTTALASSSGAGLVGYGSTTVQAELNIITDGSSTSAGTLTGAEVVNVTRGAGLLATTITAMMALACPQSATYASLPSSPTGFHFVLADETKNGQPSLYFFTTSQRYWIAMVQG